MKGNYFRDEDKIVLRAGEASESFPHELAHAIVAASVDKHCWLDTTNDDEFEAANPPGFDYDEAHFYELPEDKYKEVTLTPYGTTSSSDDAADTLRIIAQAPIPDTEISNKCVLGRSPVIDTKVTIALTRMEELAGVGQDYARKLGSFCKE